MIQQLENMGVVLGDKNCSEENEVFSSVVESVNSPLEIEIIYSLGKRPVTKVDLDLLTQWLLRGVRRYEVLWALEKLTESKWVDKCPSGDSHFVYCLTAEHERHQCALKLAAHPWRKVRSHPEIQKVMH